MGAVYRAVDPNGEATVAIKLLESANPSLADRFAREALVLSELQHPRIVRYVGHGKTDEGTPYLVMEWLAGEDLAGRLARAGLTVAESVTLVRHVAEALATAHARGVVHRDLKPSNLFLPDGKVEAVKLLDFGIAHARNLGRPMTHTGMLMGTPGYIAPEQASRGARNLDGRADIFALGCVLFECLTGRPAFAGEDFMAVVAKILLEGAPRASTLSDRVPPALDALVARMLAKNPDERPQSGAEIAAALDALGPLDGFTSVGVPRAASAITDSEQRLLSVLLLRDPQTAHEAFGMLDTLALEESAPIAASVHEAAEQHGGRAMPLADGSVVVTWWGAGVASDQAVRSARCALALKRSIAGTMITLAMGRGRIIPFPVGEVIDRAARLVKTAPARGSVVFVDQLTAGLLDARFELRGSDPRIELVGERESFDAARKLLGRASPFVGREREMAALQALFDECVSESVARAALVTAPAGCGKSRLRTELVQRIAGASADVQVWLGRGDPMNAGAPFGLLGQIVRRAADIAGGESLAEKQERLRARVARRIARSEAARVTEFLGELAGVPFPSEESPLLRAARSEHPVMAEELRRAWADFIAAECAAGPIVVVLEDLHWGDLPTVRSLDAALRDLSERPLFVLALARPEIHEVFPRLWSARGASEVRLSELTARASRRLVSEMLGQVTDEVLERVVSRAAGNAFYLEELIRAVAEGQGDSLPETVRVMMQARLEALDPDARRLLRAASVFGETFWRGGLGALLGAAPADALLAALVERELIEPRRSARFAGEQEYVFRHALVRDAAYGSFTDADRQVGHRLAAEWLAGAGEPEPIVLAEHFEHGGEPGRAIDWYRRATVKATASADLRAASADAARAIACGATGETLGALQMMRAQVEMWLGRVGPLETAAREAITHLPPGSARWHMAAVLLYVSSVYGAQPQKYRWYPEMLASSEAPPPERAGRFARLLLTLSLPAFTAGAHSVGARLLERATPLPDGDDPLVSPYRLIVRAGQSYWAEGQAAVAASLARESATLFARVHEVPTANWARLFAAQFSIAVGDHATALDICDQLLASSQADYATVVSWANRLRGMALADLERLDEALAAATESVQHVSSADGNAQFRAGSLAGLAYVLLARGDAHESERFAREAAALVTKLETAHSLGLAILTRTLLAQGRVDEARTVARDAEALLSAHGPAWDRQALVPLAIVESKLASGETAAALGAARAERQRLIAVAEHLPDEAARQRFWTRVPEHRRLVELTS
jgi:hypothetical protein